MTKKIVYLLTICFVLLFAALGYIYWQKNLQIAAAPPITKSSIEKSPELKIPKVSSFEVPILMYHYIRDAEGEDELGKNLSVSPENFEAQIKWLKDDNYAPIKLADLADPDKKTLSMVYYEKKKPIVLTFDDGYLDAYTAAFPVLEKYGFMATFFIIRNYVGRENYMNQVQIDELARSGNEIGSHSLSHPDLAKIGLEDAKSQILDSKGEAQTFCYPAGKYNDDVINLVKESGYLAAVTTKIGLARETSNLLELPRVRVENVSPQALMDKISYAEEYGIE